MAKSVQSIIRTLFADEQTDGKSRVYSWRLIRRQKRPFLLLPSAPHNPRVSLALYSAQRRRAKIWRAMLPLLLSSPAGIIFQRVRFSANESAEIIRFMAEQSGETIDRLPVPAIKFGGGDLRKTRLVMLVCDAANRPLKVIKMGLDAEGRAATDKEADLLEKLPANRMGCIRLTGRLATPRLSAFATDYYPGESPENDIGMERLFHSWINPGPEVTVESLPAWQELDQGVAAAAPAEWLVLRAALGGKTIRSTLYHGDFAPWNIRAINSQNLQAFDWERGNLMGFPGWDWFHFVVQTSILARRQSVERVAAEVEELLRSPRFEHYAAMAGIQPIAKPLLLAYLLHHRWVVRPLEGAAQIEALYELLAARWEFQPKPKPANTSVPATAPKPLARPNLWADAYGQLAAAASQLANVFWEPTLAATVSPSLPSLLRTKWPWVLISLVWLVGVAMVHGFLTKHVMLVPLYAFPCLLATLKLNRRWGTVFAWIAAGLGPLVAAAKDPEHHPADMTCWNSLMRLLIFQICVFLADRIRREHNFWWKEVMPAQRPADFARNWAVVLASALGLVLIAWGDVFTGPRISFLPLYLFPGMLITLFLNLRWGALVVFMGALVASVDEYGSKYNADVWEVFGWNFPMRFLMLYVVLLLLDRLRKDNVLFASRPANAKFKPVLGAQAANASFR
jgi:hypothetical protein